MHQSSNSIIDKYEFLWRHYSNLNILRRGSHQNYDSGPDLALDGPVDHMSKLASVSVLISFVFSSWITNEVENEYSYFGQFFATQVANSEQMFLSSRTVIELNDPDNTR